jgi:putative nucleotidyltransferase with HDIG domain
MKITTDLLRSRIARRFFLLFFLCALLPTVCLFFVSFKRVTAQLEIQNFQQLKQETKAYGISLFDRLIRVDNTLRSLASTISSATNSDSRTQKFLGNPANQLFEAIALYYEDGRAESFLGNISSEEAAELIQEVQKEKKTRIVVRPGPDQVNRLLFIVPYILENDLKYFLIGEVRPSYVWGIGTESLLPAKTEFSVYGDSGKRIAGTVFSPGSEVDNFEREKVDSDLRFFKYTVQDQKFLASAWMLFVRSNFANENWTIILSETENSHLSSLRDFKTIFFLITLLSLFLTLFLSLTFIRRALNPLNLLKKGTEQIASKDLSVILDINSGDEFEDLGKSFNSMTKQLRKQFYTLATIDKIDRAILSSLDLPKVIDTSLKMLKEFFEADIIILGRPVDSVSNTMKVHILEGRGEPVIEIAILPESELRQIVHSQPYTIIDETDFPQSLKTRFTSDYSQIVCLPLIFDKQFQSVLMLGYSTSRYHEQEELQLARQLADQVTIAISNAKLVTDLEKLILGTIEALARTVDAKSKWTAGHSERVSVLAGRIGKRMGYTETQVDLLNRGGLLHDIGKIGVPMAILDKPGKLTEDEYTEVKTHPLIGKQILDPIEAYKNIIPLVAQHHERFDGKGYPLGIAGDDLDPLARVLAVADVYDALVSSRPYREGWVLENARNFILDGSGTHFDPKVVSAFMELSL